MSCLACGMRQAMPAPHDYCNNCAVLGKVHCRKSTHSIGLLSYTFLQQTACDDVVVPVIDYESDNLAGTYERLFRHGQKQFSSNLSTILKWSLFSSEDELLKQFNDIGHHGTKIIIFNLWLNDDGNMELDFESDPEDIMIGGSLRMIKTNGLSKNLSQNYVANQLYFSLRVYVSVLYLHLPVGFQIILRGRVVEAHSIVNDLTYPECIKYKPQVDGISEAEVVTFIGFLKGAPNINIHGFNVYHRNRLILPFWKVANNSYGKGRGVAGVLEANFIKPTHDKQDFEKSVLYQKLETRLKEMTYEYWDYHCHLVGYTKSKAPLSSVDTASPSPQLLPKPQSNTLKLKIKCSVPAPSKRSPQEPSGASSQISIGSGLVTSFNAFACSKIGKPTNCNTISQTALPKKRSHEDNNGAAEPSKRLATAEPSKQLAIMAKVSERHGKSSESEVQFHEILTLKQENEKLHAECLKYEETEKYLLLKVTKLRNELQEVQEVYKKLLDELKLMDVIKDEKL